MPEKMLNKITMSILLI